MFSEASVCPQGGLPPIWGLPAGGESAQPQPPNPSPVLTSSGGHCSGRYASYWNAFLLRNGNESPHIQGLDKSFLLKAFHHPFHDPV